jgi:hypothetical protein
VGYTPPPQKDPAQTAQHILHTGKKTFATDDYDAHMVELAKELSKGDADGRGGIHGITSASRAHTPRGHRSRILLDASYRHGGLADSMNQLTDAMTNLTIALGKQGQDDDDSGNGCGDNWLVAIAKAVGDELGRLAAKLVDESRSLDSLAGDTSAGGAQNADAQTLGMLSDAFSNAIKSIGQGMQTMASKQ